MTRKQNSDAHVTVPPSNCDADTGGFSARLRALVGEQSARAFARRAGVSDTFVRQCLAGQSEPTRPVLIALATAGAVRLDWLATGQGPMREGDAQASASAGLDLAELAGAIETVEEGLAAAGKAATAAKKAELVAAVYDLFTASGTPVDKGVVLRLVKTAV